MRIKNGLPVFSFEGMSDVKVKPYECPKHGLFSSMSAIPENADITRYCPKCNMERMEAKAGEEVRRSYIAHCKECNVEKEFYFKTLDDYIPDSESQKAAKKAVEAMIESGRGKVVLLGNHGAGKTMLGSIAAKDLNGKIHTMYEISTMIRQSYTVRAERTELEIVEELASIPFLAIDELGRTKGSAAELDWLSYILDKRHTRYLPFMIMTNGHFSKNCKSGGCPKCIENYLDDDILSRLQQNSVIIDMKDAPDGRCC